MFVAKVLRRKDLHLGEHLAVTVEVVEAGGPYMSGFVVVWLRVLDRILANNWDRQDRYASRPKHAMDLAYRRPVVIDVFQNMGCIHEVVSGVIEREIPEINLVVNAARVQIGRLVVVVPLFECSGQERLGSTVEHATRRNIGTPGQAAESKILKTVAFFRATPRTLSMTTATVGITVIAEWTEVVAPRTAEPRLGDVADLELCTPQTPAKPAASWIEETPTCDGRDPIRRPGGRATW